MGTRKLSARVSATACVNMVLACCHCKDQMHPLSHQQSHVIVSAALKTFKRVQQRAVAFYSRPPLLSEVPILSDRMVATQGYMLRI